MPSKPDSPQGALAEKVFMTFSVMRARPTNILFILDRFLQTSEEDVQDIQWWEQSLDMAFYLAKQERPISMEQLVEIANLCQAKNDAYGNLQLCSFGAHGIRIRAFDKICRVANLKNTGGPVNDEALSDSLMDLMNYCVLAMLLLRGDLKCAD